MIDTSKYKLYTDDNHFVIERLYGVYTYVIGKVIVIIKKKLPRKHIYYKVLFDGVNKVLIFDALDVIKISIKELEEKYMERLTGFSKMAYIEEARDTHYFAIYDDGYSYEPGDKVIVSGDDKVRTIDNILFIDDKNSDFEIKKINIVREIICPIDTSVYEKRVKKREDTKKLKEKMDEIIKKIDEENKYAIYDKKNSEFKEIFTQYKELIG